MKWIVIIVTLLISSVSYFTVVNDNNNSNNIINIDINEINTQLDIQQDTQSQENIVVKEDVKQNDIKEVVATKQENKNIEAESKTIDNGKKKEKEKSSNKSKENQKENNQKDSNYTETEVKIAPKTECVGNKHKIDSGNTNKWFDTQEEAESFYDSEIEKWGKQWENGEIEKDVYLKNCPYGYEVWTCPQCQKWTLNFYYR